MNTVNNYKISQCIEDQTTTFIIIYIAKLLLLNFQITPNNFPHWNAPNFKNPVSQPQISRYASPAPIPLHPIKIIFHHAFLKILLLLYIINIFQYFSQQYPSPRSFTPPPLKQRILLIIIFTSISNQQSIDKKFPMFQNSWSLKLPQQPQHLTITNLPNPSFVYQGYSNQLSVYYNNHIENLPIRKQVLALHTIQQSFILILTKYTLNCFDLLNNEQKFTIEFSNAQKLSVFNNKIYVINKSSLYCYSHQGEQLYVNHLSSNITAIAQVDSIVENNSNDQIVICTDQMNMCRYNKLNIVFDYAKIVGNVTSLCWIGKGVMVGTEEGPIAYYESKKYKWKAKSVHSVQNIIKFQQISQGNKNIQFASKKADKIIVVRKDGNLQIRDWQNGSTISKIKLSESIIHSFSADFRNQGTNQIICCLQSGTITTLNINDQSQVPSLTKSQQTDTAFLTKQNDDKLQNLNKIKQQLLFNISQLKNYLEENSYPDKQGQTTTGEILHPSFQIKTKLEYKDGLILQIVSENGYISGITFEEPIIPMEVQKTTCLQYKFSKQNKSFGDIVCEVIAHSSTSNLKYQVKKVTITIPKFWKWGLDNNSSPPHNTFNQGRLKFKLIERNARFIMWIKQCFLITISSKQQNRMQQQTQLKFRFFNWYQQKYLQLIFMQLEGRIEIHSNCLKTMGEIFQDLINFIGLKHVNSQLIYPEQKQKIKQLITTIQKLTQTKKQLVFDLSEFVNNIKFLLIKSQYLRQLQQISTLKKTYIQIQQHNNHVILQLQKKAQNEKILIDHLSQLNNFINHIANIRYGQPKNQVINKCRDAIKNKRFPDIYSIMDKGVDIQ